MHLYANERWRLRDGWPTCVARPALYEVSVCNPAALTKMWLRTILCQFNGTFALRLSGGELSFLSQIHAAIGICRNGPADLFHRMIEQIVPDRLMNIFAIVIFHCGSTRHD
jgi:hypothetical protein